MQKHRAASVVSAQERSDDLASNAPTHATHETGPKDTDLKPAQEGEQGSKSRRNTRTWKYLIAGLIAVIIWEPVKIGYRELLEHFGSLIRAPSYRIVVVGPMSGPDRNLWDDVIRGVEYARADHHCESLLEKARIKIEYEDDFGDKERAKRIASRLASDRNTLAVVGPCQSDVAEAVLPTYRAANKPVVMPIPTNPGLTSDNHASAIDHVFRLPPTDVRQVMVLSKFIQRGFGKRPVALFRDGSNRTYSTYIVQNVRDSLEGRSDQIGFLEQVLGLAHHTEVVIDGWVGEQGNGLFVTDTMAAMDLPLVLYAGMRDNALTLIRQANQLKWSPTFILTDGSVDTQFLSLGGGKVEGVYATFPFGPAETGAGNPEPPPDWAQEPSFAPYGYDAIKLLAEAADRAMSQGDLCPQGVTGALRIARDGRGFGGMAAVYQFDANGDSINTWFHLWRVQDGRWIHAAECPAHESGVQPSSRQRAPASTDGN